MPLDAPCACRSGLHERACHAPANTYGYAPAQPATLSYAVPAHITDAIAAQLATMLDTWGPYTVTLASRQLRLMQRAPMRLLTLIPLLRDRPQDGTPDSYLVRAAFQGLTHWPPGPYPTPEEHDGAEQELIQKSLTWDLDRLFRIREAVGSLFHDVSPDALALRLPEIVSAIKTALPNATLDLVRFDASALGAAPVCRFLSMIEQVHPDVLAQAYAADETTYGAPYYFFHPAPHYELLANINFPYTHACGIRLGLQAYLILDYGQDITLQPIEAAERRARDIGARLLMTPRSDAIASKRFPAFTPQRRHFLRAWITARLNYIFAHLAGVHAARLRPDGCIDTGLLLKDLLILEDILALTQLIATSSDPALRRLLFFDLMDRYTQLGGTKRTVKDVLNDNYISGLIDNLDPTLEDSRPLVAEYLQDAWSRVCSGLWDGVLDQSARAAGQLDISTPPSAPQILTRSEFMPKMMYALRNTTHGYHLDWSAFEQYLTRHTGMLPDAVRELAIGLYFALLSSPERFWTDADRFTHYQRVGQLSD